MKNDDEANKAIEELNEAEYDHSQIVVKKARPAGEGGPRPQQRRDFRRY